MPPALLTWGYPLPPSPVDLKMLPADPEMPPLTWRWPVASFPPALCRSSRSSAVVTQSCQGLSERTATTRANRGTRPAAWRDDSTSSVAFTCGGRGVCHRVGRVCPVTWWGRGLCPIQCKKSDLFLHFLELGEFVLKRWLIQRTIILVCGNMFYY